MNKTELVTALAEKTGVSKKDTEQVLNAFFSTVQETLKQNDKVQIPGFGSFEVRERAARQGRNPHTGETIEIAAAKVPAFKPEKGLKDAGYEYVVIDDCWALRKRNAEGRMVADPEKFPSGMKALADYVHGQGLRSLKGT